MGVDLKKIVVLGGGPGGYVAAIRAAQLGASVTLVEEERIGGTCLNHGCIPTKFFLHAADILNGVRNAKKLGMTIQPPLVNWEELLRKKQDIIDYFVKGIVSLLTLNGVEIISGRGQLVTAREIEVTDAQGVRQKLVFDALILATGSLPVLPSVPGFELPGIQNSEGALSFSACPQSLLLIGGGVIGVELASVFASFGAKVLIVEKLPEILPGYDEELSSVLRETLEDKGVEFMNACTVSHISQEGSHFRVAVEGKERKLVDVEKVVVCVGRKPNTNSLGLENIGVTLERGRIVTNEHMETSVPGIFAIGDCTSPIMLAHIASTEGEIAAENALGHGRKMLYNVVPSGVYTTPELASVGLSEDEARRRGLDFKVGRFPLTGNGKAVICGQHRGTIKTIIEAKTGEILGVQILAPRATDAIMEAALAMRSEATIDELIATIHAHPTVSEGLREAVLDTVERGIHIPPVGRKGDSLQNLQG